MLEPLGALRHGWRMNLLAAILLIGSAPFQFEEHHLESIKPEGMNDRASIKGRIPWCKGAFQGETGWNEGRLHRAVSSRTMTAVAALQLCEAPDEPTWVKKAEILL